MVEFTSDYKFKDPYNVAFTYYHFPSSSKYYDIKPKILKILLDLINRQKCAKCNSKAYILFKRKEDAVRETDNYIVPSEQYLTKGQYLCNEHALDRIKPALKIYPYPIFYDG